MNDPYRTAAADVKPETPMRPFKVLNVSWEENEDWKEQLELGLSELHRFGYEPVTMSEGGGCVTVILKLRS